jgi:MFS family permease
MRHLTTFYIIVATQTLSLIGSRITNIGMGIWVFNQTGNTAPLLLTAFFNELPAMLGSSLAGVLVDRWERRRVIILADIGQAAGSLLLMVSFLSGSFQIWHLYLVALIQGIFTVFQQPAAEAATTMLVPEAHRERANGVKQMAFPLAGVVAPVLAGLGYVLVGITGIIAIDLATFLVAVVAIYLVRIPHPKPTEEGLAAQGGLWQEMLGGLRYLQRRRSLLGFVLYLTLINFLLNGPLELAIPYLIAITKDETVMGGLMGVMSLGALTGAGIIAMWGGMRPRMPLLLFGLLLTGAMFLIYGAARTPLILGISSFLLMLPLPISFALFTSILQVKTPPDMQGRVFAMISQLGYLGATLSFLSVGPLVDHVLEPAVGQPAWRWVEPLVGDQAGAGMGLLLVVTGLVILVTTLAVYILPHIRRLELTLPDYEALAEK